MFNKRVSFLFTGLSEIDRMEKANAVMDVNNTEFCAVSARAGDDVARGIERGPRPTMHG